MMLYLPFQATFQKIIRNICKLFVSAILIFSQCYCFWTLHKMQQKWAVMKYTNQKYIIYYFTSKYLEIIRNNGQCG